MNISEPIKTKGDVERIIEYNDGRPIEMAYFRNTILDTGRMALTASLSNDFEDTYQYYIDQMLFGDGGVTGGAAGTGETKFVVASRTGLFGSVRVSKPVIASIDNTTPSQVIFTSVISFEEGNGHNLSEMALRMANYDLYSMVTFPVLSKQPTMQITWNWRLSFV